MVSYAIMGLALIASSVSAHMSMEKPVPYGSPDTSPLSPSGSDYPCKGGAFTITTMNNWPVGSQQTLSFKGSANHAGGSCQVVYTTDTAPTKASKFKVIYSIEGGCPANPSDKFQFTIPKELPNGVGSMAWTWFNKIGNREMYMNCAPVTVTGGSSDTAEFDALPDMATANIGGSCKTSETFDYTFENPGKYVTRIGTGPFKALCGGAASPSSPGGKPSALPPTPTQGPVFAPTGGPASSAAPSVPASSAAPSVPAVSSAPPASQITSTISTLITVTAPVAVPTSAVAVPSSTDPKPTQAPGTPQKDSCPTDGAIVCNGTSQFGICNFGKVVWQDVAAGTQCQDGKVVKREYTHRARRSYNA